MAKKKLKKIVETVKRFHEDEEGWSMNLNEYVTTTQAAEMLGVIPTSVNHLLQDGRIQGHKFGHSWMVYVPSIKKYLETKTPTGRPPSRMPQPQ